MEAIFNQGIARMCAQTPEGVESYQAGEKTSQFRQRVELVTRPTSQNPVG